MPRRHTPLDADLLRHARAMRAEPTPAESLLWRRLRAGQVGGARFRRQAPLGPYIADFLCAAGRLVIELDGGQHGEADGRARDEERTAWLRSEGWTVLRFWNHEVLRDTDRVLAIIWRALAERGALRDTHAPPEQPSPTGGRWPAGPDGGAAE